MEEIEERSKKDIGKDLDAYDALAMSCLQLVNRLVDLGKVIISERHLGFPETYTDVFKALRNAGIITDDELKLVTKLVYYRDLISHEYSNITPKELMEFRENLPKIKKMVERLKTSFS